MKPKSLEIFIPGPAGRLEAKYYKNPKFGSPVAIVLTSSSSVRRDNE